MYIGNVQVCTCSKKQKKTKKKKKRKKTERKYNNSQKGKCEQGKITHARCFPELFYTINLMVIFFCNLHLMIETFWLNFRRK